MIKQCLARIAAADPALQAFQLVLDGELPAGSGPLSGIPVALKDNIDVAGVPTSGGSRLYGGRPATQDADVVRKLRAAGAILIGKTRMQELAFGGWGTNAVFGTPRNPYDLAVHRVPGGSSSGSAVAVAARLVRMAIGTDTGGSVRIPAAVCGVVGLKTTLGQIARDGILPLARSLDTVGPMTTSVADAELLYTVLAGHGAGRAGAVAGTPLRIGTLPDAELAGCDPDVLAALARAMQVLRDRGAELREIALDSSFDTLVEKNGVLIASEGWQAHGDRITAHPNLMDPAVLKRFLRGRDLPARDYAAALNEQIGAQERVPKLFGDLDALLTPTVPMPAIPVADVNEDVLPFNRYTRAVNYLGLCALTIPAGLSRAGLPLGVQLIGLADTERRLLEIGQFLEDGLGRLPPPDLSALGLP
ncbi:MAG: amidase [Gammaproteobacteria bacterium]